MHEISAFESQQISRMIKQIRIEESAFDFDMRSSNREKIFLPVDIKSLSSLTTVRGFSRNISATGVCLVSEDPVDIGEVSLLRFLRRNMGTCELMAQCRWAKFLGHGYTMSGWQFTEAVCN